MARRALLLINPRARQGSALRDTVAGSLAKAGLDIVVEPLGDGRTAIDLIERHRQEVTDIVIGGGDGTLNAAAGALVEAGLPVGILPLGTANDLALSLIHI